MGQILSICQKEPKKPGVEVQQPSRLEKPIHSHVQKPPRAITNSGSKLAESPVVSNTADLPPAEAARLAAEKRSEIHKEKTKTRLPKTTFY
ncbi:conserved fungal protein of unknown function [Schizosaccharomyces osmophilus]|uniref:Uncharacterized protein n=1 Tax=Schizosaccharomyces osmophilus TaxID=2545709 RepID=A0AAE9WB48_9SCHI|nr:conserved fungal protein of unknown function [Schizosaccharomyces osmophilus]WBW73016.1 conserved fungal protein of unknown function [Schizosaccharomyces osmophilus]